MSETLGTLQMGLKEIPFLEKKKNTLSHSENSRAALCVWPTLMLVVLLGMFHLW